MALKRACKLLDLHDAIYHLSYLETVLTVGESKTTCCTLEFHMSKMPISLHRKQHSESFIL